MQPLLSLHITINCILYPTSAFFLLGPHHSHEHLHPHLMSFKQTYLLSIRGKKSSLDPPVFSAILYSFSLSLSTSNYQHFSSHFPQSETWLLLRLLANLIVLCLSPLPLGTIINNILLAILPPFAPRTLIILVTSLCLQPSSKHGHPPRLHLQFSHPL